MMNKFKTGDNIIFVGPDDWIPYGTKGVIIKQSDNIYIESYIVALDGITPKNGSKGIECVEYDLLPITKTPIEEYIENYEEG